MIAWILVSAFVVDLQFLDGSSVQCLEPESIIYQAEERRIFVAGCASVEEEILFRDSFEGVSS